MFEPGMGPNPPRVRRDWGGCLSQSAIGPWDWGFHTVRGGVDPGQLDFRLRGVGVVDI